MLRRLIMLATSLILCGVLALSVPVLAADSAPGGKTTVVKVSPVKPAIVKQSGSLTTTIMTLIKFQFGRWIGLPHVDVNIKPLVTDPPQKSNVPPRKPKPWEEAMADNGGHEQP